MVKHKITRWWHTFTEMKLWVQIIIVAGLVLLAHNYLLH